MKKKKFEDLQKSRPNQLTLFEMLDEEDSKFSQNFAYDVFPKYFWGKAKRIEGRFLNILEREFRFNKTDFKIRIFPAAIEENEGTYYYLTEREEFVEDALRKLMVEGRSVFLDGEVGVRFTLYELQKELKRTGHSYSYDQIKDSLKILNRTKIEVISIDGKVEINFSPVDMLGFKDVDGEVQTFVRFSNIVTSAIMGGQFRLFNYEVVMNHKSVVARQLHKRLAMVYRQGSLKEADKYSIRLSRIITDLGLTAQKYLSDNLKTVHRGLEELVEAGVLNHYEEESIGEKGKTKDVLFHLYPSVSFIKEIKYANLKERNVRNYLEAEQDKKD